ncbi:MAG: hypothetical protein R3D98_12845 [Candidatus Krumholzibacteriia bacterium]
MRRLPACGAVLVGLLAMVAAGARAQSELTYDEYRAIARTANQMQRCAMFEPLDGEAGMNLVVGDRFGKLNVIHILPGGQRRTVWTSRQLDGAPEEVLVADLNQDGLDDHLVCRTLRRLYVFKLDDYYNAFESQPNDFSNIRTFTVANVDADPAAEIVINADQKIHYIDGLTFTREFTSLNNYEATRMRCGDVTGDGQADIVLNTGQVIDASSGEVIWQDEVFGNRLELLDIDGDGILEVVTEGDSTPLKVWDVDFRQEKRF